MFGFLKKKKERYPVELRYLPLNSEWRLFSLTSNRFKTEQQAIDYANRFDFRIIRPIIDIKEQKQ